MRVVYTGGKFKVLKARRGYLIVKINNDFYKEHGHFKSFRAARELALILERGELPYCDYYKECAKRLLTDEEFKALKVHKFKKKFKHDKRERLTKSK